MSEFLLTSLLSGMLGALAVPLLRLLGEAARFKRRFRHPDIFKLKSWLKQQGLRRFKVPQFGGLLRRTSYRSREIPEKESSRTYHFFLRESIDLEEFKGILIPALDNNHGGLDSALSSWPPWDELEKEPWLVYLYRLGMKIQRPYDGSAQHSVGGGPGPIPAKRIIIFDKYLLNTFLQSPKELKDISGYRPPLSAKDPIEWAENPGAFSRSARAAIQTAFEIASIHTVLEPFSHKSDTGGPCISTIYLDKARVESNRFYDFGLYRLGGVKVVFHPVYLKNIGRRVVREKVFIAENMLQHSQIHGFETEFDALFDIYAGLKVSQEGNLKNPAGQASKYFTNLSTHYFEDEDAFLFEYFERGYIYMIKKVLDEEFGIGPDVFLELRDRLRNITLQEEDNE